MTGISKNERKEWLQAVKLNAQARLENAIALRWLTAGTFGFLLLILIAITVHLRLFKITF